MAKKKAKPLTKVYDGWVPEGETFKETLGVMAEGGYNDALYRTKRECLKEGFDAPPIRRKITVIIEDV